MVVTGIVVVGTTDGTSYMGSYSETGVPSGTAMEMGITVQPETEEEPGIKGGSVQYLLALPSSLNMILLFSLS